MVTENDVKKPSRHAFDGYGSLSQFDQNNMIYYDDKRYDWATPTEFTVLGERLMTTEMILP